jgi:D-alanyl-lipoteichoic acid acyltransferase DltB (MBOAT superfamily)
MLFNSISFICFFLPITLLIFFLFGRFYQRLAMAWLSFASLVFYSWLGTNYLLLLILSILFNYSLGSALGRFAQRERLATWLLVFGVSCNLLALVYYKYLFNLTGWGIEHGLPLTLFGSAILPLGISFFTFTQIGFLVDSKGGVTKAHGFLDYTVFVTFFPHLIAGPILHHREIMPQFLKDGTYRFNTRNFCVGLSIFTVGLAKKVLIADWFSPYVAAVFNQPHNLNRADAWCGVLSYFVQLYFDFSGYSEMAIGLARMFNVTFPANFDSPYKARNVIEFWQRWHMSLTRYVNLYVYNPIALAITRARYAKGKAANAKALKTLDGFSSMVALPTMITMTLIGVWHGSGLQFLIFGLLHGIYLCIAHAWRLAFHKRDAQPKPRIIRYGATLLSVGLTCGAVLLGQVFFRAKSISDAMSVLAAMTLWPARAAGALPSDLHHPAVQGAAIALALGFVWIMPNTLQIFASESPALAKSRAEPPLIQLRWNTGIAWGLCLGCLFTLAFLSVTGTTEFLYFRF